MKEPLRVGLSTCPNDTFLFHALLEGIVPCELPIEFVLADVEELNLRMRAGELALSKASFHAMLGMAERVWVLPTGAALGFGVGPLLLAAPGRPTRPPLDGGAHVLTPGRWTTAALLIELLADALFDAAHPRREHTLFSAILPRLAAGEADYGACIHEARFTWQAHGVGWVADLGRLFEERAGAALPLGGLCASRALGRPTARALLRAVRSSLEWGQAHRSECLPSMRRHSQEASDDVLWAHVDLYVNAWTAELGSVGRAALAALERLGRERGLVPPDAKLVLL